MCAFATATRSRGFTLLEVLIVLLIVGILAAIAYPSYESSVRKGRRAEGHAALTAIHQGQEKYRTDNPAYAATVTTLGLPLTSENAYYALSLSGASATGFTASAAPTGAQAGDACGSLTLVVVNGNVSYGPNLGCWGR